MSSEVIKHNGIRVITTEGLADAYKTTADNIKVNFNNNKENFEIGKHYYYLEGAELKEFKRQVNDIYPPLVNKYTSGLYLWTERGANRHCKILDTDKAWEQFDNLEQTYFRVKEGQVSLEGMSKEIQAIIMLDRSQQEIKTRVGALENNMTINYSQQYTLREIANKIVIKILGGKDSPAYKEVGKKAFSSIWRDYKRKFQINSYANTLLKDFADGKEFLSNWKPERDLELMIRGANFEGGN